MKIKEITLIFSLFFFSGCSYLFDEGNTELMKAVFEANITKVEKIALSTDNIDETNAHGLTALMYASRGGKKEIVKILLNHGADSDRYSKGTDFFLSLIYEAPITTALQEALGKSHGITFNQNHIDTAKILIEHNTYIDEEAIYKLGSTGDIELLELMLSKKNRAISNNLDFYSAALCGAVSYKKFKMLKYLISHGANPNELQYEGCSALDNATWTVNLQMVEYLLEHGANPNIKLEHGRSVLYGATWVSTNKKHWNDNYKIIKLLIEHGADKNFKPKNGDKSIVELLRDKIKEYEKEDKEVAIYFANILKLTQT